MTGNSCWCDTVYSCRMY